MAESTLALTYQQLQAMVGVFLGYGRGANYGDVAWDNTQAMNINDSVASGLRQFYFPAPDVAGGSAYDWSFMRPVANIDFPAGKKFIPLPDDFGGLDGDLTVLSSTTQLTWQIELTNEARIRHMYQIQPQMSGRPLFAAIEPLRGTSGEIGQRFQLILFPLADQEYTLQVTYYISPDNLNVAAPYPYGGAVHAETIREACLMAAENFLDDGQSVHQAKFAERMAASISMDRRLKPQHIGYNRDRSDYRTMTRQDLHYLTLVKVNGVQY